MKPSCSLLLTACGGGSEPFTPEMLHEVREMSPVSKSGRRVAWMQGRRARNPGWVPLAREET